MAKTTTTLLRGGNGNDFLFGGDDNDDLFGGLGNDDLWGDDGNDELTGGAGVNFLYGGSGTDTAIYENASRIGYSQTGVTANLATGLASGVVTDAQGVVRTFNDFLSSIENVTGSDFEDVLIGDSHANVLRGGNGEDDLTGGEGGDTLFGGGGNDTAFYVNSDAAVTIDLRNDIATGGHASGDSLFSIESIEGSDYGDFLWGDGNDNVFYGHDGNDVLHGRMGIDALFGGIGNDLLSGGSGERDFFDGGPGFDTLSYSTSNAGVTVNLETRDAEGGHAEGDVFQSIENIIGSDHDDVLTGEDGVNILRGGGGDDLLEGGENGDTLDGGEGTDTASYENSLSGIVIDLGRGTAEAGALGDVLESIENIKGSGYGDVIDGGPLGQRAHRPRRCRHAQRKARRRYPVRRHGNRRSVRR